jgi:hypothetical protein
MKILFKKNIFPISGCVKNGNTLSRGKKMGFTFDFFCTPNLFIIAPKLVQLENERFTIILYFLKSFIFTGKCV